MTLIKLSFYLILISFNIHLKANETSPNTSNVKCDEFKKSMKAQVEQLIRVPKNALMDRDNLAFQLGDCVELSEKSMRLLYTKRKDVDQIWEQVIKSNNNCAMLAPECSEALMSDPNKDQYTKECNEFKSKALQCDGAAFLINAFERDWENSEHVNTPTIKGGNPPIECKGQGVATFDYEPCVKFVQNGDLMEVAQRTIHGGQELYYQDKTLDAQLEASKNPNSATSQLEAMHGQVKNQESMMNQRMALDAGKLAALSTLFMQIPSYEDLKEKCKSYRNPKSLVPKDEDTELNGCNLAVSNQHNYGFLMNSSAKDKMKSKLVQVGLEGVSDAVRAKLLSDNAKDLKNAIAKVNNFKPINPIEVPIDNLQTTYCQQNPGDPKCLVGGLNRTFDPLSENIINFGDGGLGTSFTTSTPETAEAITPTNGNNLPGTSVASVGTAVNSAPDSGGLKDVAAAAAVGPGQSSGGGGGSGGGGSGAGGGGGGGAPPSQGGVPGGTSAAIQGKTPTYSGGTGTITVGGFGINKAKSKSADDSNPFGKLFGKEGSKNETLNFQGRAPASLMGKKNEDLFEMISRRYSNVSSSKRLLEYELSK